MPHVIVTADGSGKDGGAVMLRERVNVADFESEHFATQLVERLGWAVEDAAAAERASALEIASDAVEAAPVVVAASTDEVGEIDEPFAPDPAAGDREYATAGVTHDG